MAALIPALIKLLISRRGGGGGYSRGGYGRGGSGGGGDKSMYYTNLAALKEGQDLPNWDKQVGAARSEAAERKAAAVESMFQFTEPPAPKPGGRK